MANTKLPARLLDTSAIPALNVTGDLTVDTNTLKVDSTNNRVGINTTSPSKPLDITADSGANAISVRARSGDDYSFFQFFNNAGNALRGQIYSNAAGDIGFTTGTDSSAGNDLYIKDGGGVGIGTTSPAQTLHVSSTGATSNGIRISNSEGSFDARVDQGEFYLYDVDDNRIPFLINTSGNIGIGTTSPADYTYGDLVIDGAGGNAGISLVSAANGYGGIFFADGTSGSEKYRGFLQYNHNYSSLTDKLLFGSGGATNMVLDGSGKLGIGTTNPGSPLDIETAGNIQDGTFYSTITINNTGSSTFSGLRYDRSGVARFRVGLRNDDKFQIANLFKNGSVSADDEAFVMLNNGNIGIGTASPGSILTIHNDSTAGNTQLYVHNNKSTDAAVLRLEGKRTSLNDTGQIIFANNGYNVAKIDARSAADDGEMRFFTSASGTGNSVDQKMTVLSTPKSRSEVHVRGGLAIGDGNTGTVNDPGCRVLGWYNANCHGLGTSYLHLVTDLWGGGSPAGNSSYIMGGFRITGHQYSTNYSYGECGIFFHNWAGSVGAGYSISYTGVYTGFAHAYVNSSGYVVLRLNAGSYKHYWVDLFQSGFYPIRNIKVTAATASSSATL